MNRSFLIVGIPAVLTSFGWLAFGWGWRVAVTVTSAELLIISAFVVYIVRRQNQRRTLASPARVNTPETGAATEARQTK
jgi:membrane protein implicated in regulation of membrane protease activity